MKILTAVLGACLMSFTAHAAVEEMSCVGTEPFWGLDIKGEAVAFSEIGGAEPITFKAQFGSPEGVPPAYVMTIKGKNEKSALIAFIHNGFGYMIAEKDGKMPQGGSAKLRAFCSDGMSDRFYPYSVNLEVNGRLLTGCCYSPKNPFIETRTGL